MTLRECLEEMELRRDADAHYRSWDDWIGAIRAHLAEVSAVRDEMRGEGPCYDEKSDKACTACQEWCPLVKKWADRLTKALGA